MCGFVGFIDKRNNNQKTKIINLMIDKIIHRGPNSYGKYVDNIIALGFR